MARFGSSSEPAAVQPTNDEEETTVPPPPTRRQFLLSFRPIDPKHYDPAKAMFDADAIIELFDEALDKYEIDMNQLVFLVGDNASVNGSIGRNSKLPLIGCASHRLNLAVQSHVAWYSEEVEMVAALMRHLRFSKQRTLLRKMECSMPVIKNSTRWPSTYLMIRRYLELSEHLDDMDMDLAAYLPTPREKIKIKALYEDLQKFQSIKMELQHSDGVQLKDVRILFDKLLETFETEGTCTKHLATTAKVVAVPAFEDGIVKIQTGRESEFSPSERKALAKFERPVVASLLATDNRNKTMSFAGAALQVKQTSSESKYLSLGWIPPTSDDVERLFSQAGQVYNEQRQGMLPANLELVLFLRFNRSLWDEVAVARAMRSRSETRKRKRQQTLFENEMVV